MLEFHLLFSLKTINILNAFAKVGKEEKVKEERIIGKEREKNLVRNREGILCTYLYYHETTSVVCFILSHTSRKKF